MSGTELFATFLGSVALLLWGVRMVRTGMTRAFGSQLRRAISTYARTRIGGFIAGVGITGVLQSSTATTMLLASFAARGLIALPIALAVVLGADVGGALAPFLTLSALAPAGRRVPLGNLMMRTAVALPVLFLVTPIASWLALLEPDPGRIAINFHTAFNLVVAALFLPAVALVAKLAARVLPDLPQSATSTEPKHLDPTVLDTPSDALGCAMRETLHMGDRVADMLRQALVVFEKSDPKLVKEVEKADNTVDALHEAIKLYMVKLSKAEMTEEESQRYVEIITFTTNLEHVGDIIDKNLMELAAKKIKNRYA